MKYTKIKTLGAGGFGIVDKVRRDDGEIFAQKTFSLTNQQHRLTPDLIENVKKRFVREALCQEEININSSTRLYVRSF